MLRVRALDDDPSRGVKKDDEYRFYIVDAHHHMGKEGSHRNSPTSAYEFYALLWFELKKFAKEMKENDDLLFEPIGIIPPPLQNSIFNLKKNWRRWNHGWLIDRTIVFPYTDDYSGRTDDGSASFRISNDKIAGWTTRAPHSSRLIGFCRVDPNDALAIDPNMPVKEIRRSATELGLRGLKLHPLAQLFTDHIESAHMQDIIQEANKLGMPVVFDSRNIHTAIRIKNLIESIRDEINNPSFCPSVILAHAAMSPGRQELYDILQDPSFLVDTSSLHDRDIPLLFESAQELVSAENSVWSEKILFGTDYSFLSVQATELILYLLSRRFSGGPRDIQNILGGNALKIITRPVLTYRKTDLASQQIICKDKEQKTTSVALSTITHLFEKGWDLTSTDYLPISGNGWPVPIQLQGREFSGINFEVQVLSFRHEETDRELVIWITPNKNNHISLNIHGSGPFPSLMTLAETSTSSNNLALRGFYDNSQPAKNAKIMLSKLDNILKS
jgi:predicted TIM-barrel fold metal-dependent hydrolase